jgi:hypothetical protein
LLNDSRSIGFLADKPVAFTLESLLLQIEIALVDFTTYEIESKFVGCYATASASKERVKDFTPPLLRNSLISKHIEQ